MFNKKRIKELLREVDIIQTEYQKLANNLDKLTETNRLLSQKVNPSPQKTYTLDAIELAKEIQNSPIGSNCKSGKCGSSKRNRYYKVSQDIIDNIANKK